MKMDEVLNVAKEIQFVLAVYGVTFFVFTVCLFCVLNRYKKQAEKGRTHCKDCRYCYNKKGNGVTVPACKLKHNWMPQPDWFCADGEPKEGDEK